MRRRRRAEELPVASATAAIEAPAGFATGAVEPASHPLPEFAPVEPPAAAVMPAVTAPVRQTPPEPAIKMPANDAEALEAVAAQITSTAGDTDKRRRAADGSVRRRHVPPA